MLGAAPLDPGDVARVARERAPVVLAPEVARRLIAARAVVEDVGHDHPVYGITRGLGANKDATLAADDPATFSRRVVVARAVAVGPPLPADVVRAILLARVSAMATGGSVASAAVERVIKLLTPAHSGLPLNLTRHGPAQTGLATVQKTVTALAVEMRHLAQPGSLDFMPVSAGIEDHASNAPFTVAKAGEAVERLAYVAAMELLIAAQAVELRSSELGRALDLGCGPRAALTAVRSVVPALDEDRPPGPDIERIRQMLGSGALLP